MSTEVQPSFETLIKETLREVVREEFEALQLDDKLLTAEHVAEMLDYTDPASVRELARKGHLEPVDLGQKTRRYRKSDVQRLIKNGVS